MKKSDMSKVLYVLLMILVFVASQAFGQIEVRQFNAEWNSANSVSWFMDLKDCKTKGITDIAKFQADLSFKMVATREEVQEEIHNQLMSDF